MNSQKEKIISGAKRFSRKSGLFPGFTTIRKCASECDAIVAMHAHMARRCKRKSASRCSSEADEMRRPNSERNSAPSAFTDPRVLKAMGTNTWVEVNNG